MPYVCKRHTLLDTCTTLVRTMDKSRCCFQQNRLLENGRATYIQWLPLIGTTSNKMRFILCDSFSYISFTVPSLLRTSYVQLHRRTRTRKPFKRGLRSTSKACQRPSSISMEHLQKGFKLKQLWRLLLNSFAPATTWPHQFAVLSSNACGSPRLVWWVCKSLCRLSADNADRQTEPLCHLQFSSLLKRQPFGQPPSLRWGKKFPILFLLRDGGVLYVGIVLVLLKWRKRTTTFFNCSGISTVNKSEECGVENS